MARKIRASQEQIDAGRSCFHCGHYYGAVHPLPHYREKGIESQHYCYAPRYVSVPKDPDKLWLGNKRIEGSLCADTAWPEGNNQEVQAVCGARTKERVNLRSQSRGEA